MAINSKTKKFQRDNVKLSSNKLWVQRLKSIYFLLWITNLEPPD